MNIQIYTDNVSANHILYYALARLYGKKNVCFVNANEILNGALTDSVDVLVMPGGASRYKADKLNGAANHIIKTYVERGGRYFGICAGAYMGCNMTKWAQGLPHEIITENELAFFSGVAIGPIEAFGRGDNYNQTDAHLVTLEYQGKLVPSLYLGGCVFRPDTVSDDEESAYKVLASFADLPEKPAAIVSGQYGQGRWLLCSTHPEYDNEAVKLVDFNVIGNQYEHFSRLPDDADLGLELLESLLANLTSC
ncbi:BPL-N domain-containing protein [Marinomonas sp. C2222]|uniref:BPL-N domain-containing protein n=1 Tax=Marinomonas sargassi TaxID=2984494 RepID=A0ABT2YQJ9_9GAMM|nr:BPL-N domain-containing protein [Marinomonas sargassi]MCV2401939.1 BPL-N domain-containing protein [Marinomonas sargassi]